MARAQWQKPDRQPQFEILGVQPWGGPREEPVLGGKRPRPEERTEVLARCWALMQTAAAMAEFAIGANKTTRLDEEHCSGLPVHPYALQDAIRAHYDRHPWLSPLDVMQHACRVADRVLFLTGDRDRPDADSYTGDNAEMARRTPEVARCVKAALEAKGGEAGRGAIAVGDVAPKQARTLSSERPAATVAPAPLPELLSRAYHCALLANNLTGSMIIRDGAPLESRISRDAFDAEIAPDYPVTPQRRAERALLACEAALDATDLYERPFTNFGWGSREKVNERARNLLRLIEDLAASHRINPHVGALVPAEATISDASEAKAPLAAPGKVIGPPGVSDGMPAHVAVATAKQTGSLQALPAPPPGAVQRGGPSHGSTAETDDDLGPAPNDPAEWRAYARKVRRGQPKFRANLMKLYECACCISGWSPENVLEAAHIDPHSATGDNSVANGLLLRSDLHSLFDDGLLHVDPDTLTVVLDPALFDTPYRELHGRKLRERRDGSTPDGEKLRLRWATRSR